MCSIGIRLKIQNPLNPDVFTTPLSPVSDIALHIVNCVTILNVSK